MSKLTIDDIKRNITHYVNGVPETGAGNVLIAGDITPQARASIREKIINDINAMPPEWVMYFAIKRPKMVFADRATIVREHGQGDVAVMGFYNPIPMQFLGHAIKEPAIYNSMSYYSGPNAHKDKQDRQQLTYDSHTFWHEAGHYGDDASAPGVARYWSDSFKPVEIKGLGKVGLWDAMTKIYQVQVRKARAEGQEAYMSLPKHVRIAGNYANVRHSGGSHGGRELYALVNQDWMQNYRDMKGDQEAIYAKMEKTWGKDILTLFHASRIDFMKEVQAATNAVGEKVQAYIDREVATAKANGTPLQTAQVNELFDRAMKSCMQTGLLPDEVEAQQAARDIEVLRKTHQETFAAFASKHGFAKESDWGNGFGFWGAETTTELAAADVKRFGNDANAIELATHQLRSAPNLFAKKITYQDGAVRETPILKVAAEEYVRLNVLTGDEKQTLALMKEQYPYLIPSFQPQIETAAKAIEPSSVFVGHIRGTLYFKEMEKYQRLRWELQGNDPAAFTFDRQKELDVLLDAYRSQGRVNLHFAAEDQGKLKDMLKEFIDKAAAQGEDAKTALARFDAALEQGGVSAVKIATLHMSREFGSYGNETVAILKNVMASVQSELTGDEVKAVKLAFQETGGARYDLKEHPKIFWNDLDADRNDRAGASDVAYLMLLRALNKGNKAAVKLADGNGDGKLNKDELESLNWMMRRVQRTDYDKQPSERVIDLDGNGALSDEELAQFAAKLGLDVKNDVKLSDVQTPILQQLGSQLVQFAKEVNAQNNLTAQP